jgi:hypothetical protein
MRVALCGCIGGGGAYELRRLDCQGASGSPVRIRLTAGFFGILRVFHPFGVGELYVTQYCAQHESRVGLNGCMRGGWSKQTQETVPGLRVAVQVRIRYTSRFFRKPTSLPSLRGR